MLSEGEIAELLPAGGPIGGRKADHVHDLLMRAILFRRLAPGTQLLEQALARDLHCSQGTVREALLRLAEDGLVERRGYQGTVVTETTLDEAVEMVRIRLRIERAAAVRLASRGLGAAGEAETGRLLAEMDAAHQRADLSRCSELDRAFHAALVRSAGMGLLSPILSRCALHIHRFTLGGVEVPRDFYQEAGLGDEHRALLARLMQGPPSEAAQAVADHLARVLGRWAPSLLAAAGSETFRPTDEETAADDALHDPA